MAPPPDEDARPRPGRKPKPKIFAIGFNKCGTASLAQLLAKNGIRTVHWVYRRQDETVNIALAIHHNIAVGRRALAGVDNFTGYTDLNYITDEVIIEACRYYPAIYQNNRQAYYILNTRNVDRWIRSRFGHGNFAARYAKALGCPDDESLAALWRHQFERHHEEVRAFFARRPSKFLEFDIEADDPQKLADFLAPHHPIDIAHWVNRNPSASRGAARED